MKQLLIVDDDKDIRTLVAEQLTDAGGYRVSTAASGAEMRRKLDRAAIDLVVLDLNLRNEDGLQLCRELRARSSVPVIMLTARSSPIDRILGLEMGPMITCPSLSSRASRSAPGIPRLMLTPDRFRILVRADVINVMFEWNRLLRQINLREPPRDPDWGTVSGQSWGGWEGDVLVVESRGFSRKRLLDNLMPNSDELTLMERFRLKDRNTLEDRITINDPKIFTRPWEAVVLYKRTANEPFPEDVCLDRKAAGQLPLPK